MSQRNKETKKGKPRSAGKRATKRSVYYSGNYFRNKLRRILDHNGPEAAKEWSKGKGIESILRRMTAGK